MKEMKIFSNYISALGTGALKNVNYNDLIIYAIINPINSVKKANARDVVVLDELLKKNDKSKYVNIKKFKDYKLLNVKEKTFNKDTLEDSDHSYQELRNENIKEYVFNDDMESYSKYSPIKQSLDYDDAQHVYEYDQHKPKIRLPSESQRIRYNALIHDYNIQDNGYNKSNFSRLSVKEDKIIESEIALTADDFVYTEYTANDKILNHGIYGFYLSIMGSKEIPVMICIFDQPTYSNYNKIKLVFNADGFFGVV